MAEGDMAECEEDININEQLKRGLITFAQWKTAKNLEERIMLESLVQQGMLTEEQFEEEISAQNTRRIESTDISSKLNEEHHDSTQNKLVSLVYGYFY